MVSDLGKIKTYTIRETAKLSGLPESTLRYYENIGLIKKIYRDKSSKHRVYSEDDVNQIILIACLNATELSIEQMRQYLKNRELGPSGASNQVALLSAQAGHLEDTIHYAQLRLAYVKSKIDFWKAVEDENKELIESCGNATKAIAKKLRLPSKLEIEKPYDSTQNMNHKYNN